MGFQPVGPAPPEWAPPAPDDSFRFCPGCGSEVVASDSFCRRCGRGLGAASPSAPYTTKKEASHWARNLVVGLVLLLLFLLLFPLPIPFNTQFETYAVNPQAAPLGLPGSLSISGSWHTNNGGSVALAIVNGNDSTVYSADASSGSFSLGFAGEPYKIEAYSVFPETVTVNGTAWSPLLNVGLP